MVSVQLTPTCSVPSAPTCASARSSTFRTGSCPSISRGSSSSDGLARVGPPLGGRSKFAGGAEADFGRGYLAHPIGHAPETGPAAPPLLSVRGLTAEVATPEGPRVVVEDVSFD